jgi:antitoxin MazE
LQRSHEYAKNSQPVQTGPATQKACRVTGDSYILCIYKEQLAVKTQLAKWGNSMAVRIPRAVAEAAKLRPGDDVEMAVEGSGTIKIRRRRREPTLEQLVEAITVENRHGEVDWGKPVGHEVW